MNNFIVYSASAGSGKTFTLALRYIKMLLLQGQNSHRRILAVTFTNDATNEMKQRIISELSLLADAVPDNKFRNVLRKELPENVTDEEITKRAARRLHEILHDYSRFWVMTIDSFFIKIVQNLAHELGVGSKFNIELNNDTATAGAVNAVINKASQNEKMLQTLLEYVNHRIEQDDKWNIKEALIEFSAQNLFSEKFQIHSPALQKALNENPNAIKELKEKCRNIKREYEENTPQYNTASILLDNIFQLELTGDIDKEVDLQSRENMRFLLSKTAVLLHGLLKENSGNASFIYEKIGAEISSVMIDEFQDTSFLQWQNFKYLISEIIANNNFCMIVGDVKQSIYRFRNGDWQILNNIEKETFAGIKAKVENLSFNYRSRKNIVEFNNNLFTKIIACLDTEKNNADIQKAYKDVRQNLPAAGKDGGYVEVCFYDKKEKYKYLVDILTKLRDNNVAPKDIAILCRSNSDIKSITEYLSDNGFYVVNPAAYTLKSCDAVRFVIAALGVLKSARNKICEEEMLRIASRNGITDFKINHLKDKSLQEMVYGLLRIYKPQEYETAFVYTFLDKVNTFSKNNICTTANFLSYWNNELCNVTLEQSKSQDGIIATTIHKSKGLEYHTVIIPFINWQMSKQGGLIWVENNNSDFCPLPVLPADFGKSLQNSTFSASYYEEEKMNRMDTLNTLYVALTRAESNLFLMVENPPKKRGAERLQNYIFDSVGSDVTCIGDIVPSEKMLSDKLLHRTGNGEIVNDEVVGDKIIDDGPTSGGTVNDSVVSGEIIDDGPTNGGTVNDSIVSGEIIDNGPTNGGTVNDSVVSGEIIDDGLTSGGTVNDSVVVGEIIDGGAVNGEMAFLKEVAEKIIEKYGNDFSNITVVLPSNRARIFLDRYLPQSPEYSNTYELLSKSSQLKMIDDTVEKISLIEILYHCYIKNCFGEAAAVETFDEFYSFGEILLSDFNEIDMEMVDAKFLFMHIADLQRMKNDWDNLSDGQRELVTRFFDFSKHRDTDTLSKKFFSIWDHLYDVYEDFRSVLREKGVGYEGMVMRDAVESGLNEEAFENREFIFAGFNNLTKTEIALIEKLRSRSQIFEDTLNDLSSVGKITIVEAPNATAQTAYISDFIKDTGVKDFSDAKTAIVLCDDTLLSAVIGDIPSEVNALNVSINFPLKQTAAAGILEEKLVELQNDGEGLPKNASEMISILLEFLNVIKEKTYSPMEKEALNRAEQILLKTQELPQLQQRTDISSMGKKTIARLLLQIFGAEKVPFSADPAAGLQIMAMSDTRNMDFDNLLVLSVNEGIMPKGRMESSFIPLFLRHHYGMQDIQKNDAVYAYNFFRLIKRAKNVHFVYSTDGVTGKGEKSRFIMQIENELKHGNIKHKSVNLKKKIFAWQPLSAIAKNEMPDSVSPSAINTYIDCKMKYYFSKILHLKNDDNTADELSSAALGNILHKTIELIYSEAGNEIGSGYIESCIDRIDEFILKSFSPVTGEEMLYFNIVKQMVRNILKYDISMAPFNITGLEKECSVSMDNMLIKGYADRIIEKNGTIYVQDFKTGKFPSDNDFGNIATVFSEERKYKASYLLQLLIYSMILAKDYPDKKIIPVLLFAIADKERIAVDVVSKIKDNAVTFDDVKDIFDDYFLHFFKDDFLNGSVPFVQRENKDTKYGVCGFCAYGGICGL